MGQVRLQVLTDPSVTVEGDGFAYIQVLTNPTVTVEGARVGQVTSSDCSYCDCRGGRGG